MCFPVKLLARRETVLDPTVSAAPLSGMTGAAHMAARTGVNQRPVLIVTGRDIVNTDVSDEARLNCLRQAWWTLRNE